MTMDKKTTIYLGTGTNIGDRDANLAKANKLVGNQVGTIIMASSVYSTKAWGNRNQDDFYNQVLKIETELSPTILIKKVLDIEKEMGRFRNEKWGPRLIDIDVLFYESEIIDSENLTVPHPHIAKRNFVLVPMREIAADFIHPVYQQTIEELYLDSTDTLEVFQLVTN